MSNSIDLDKLQGFTEDQIRLGNMYTTDRTHHTERSVIGTNDFNNPTYIGEVARYTLAAQYVNGKGSVLDIGCSSGFGAKLLNAEQYLGIDYDPTIIEYANRNFKKPNVNFLCTTVDNFFKNDFFFDTIVAFECMEHLHNGLEIAQELKKHCNTLLISVPYNEPVGWWGKYHVLHKLTEKNFPDFEYKFIDLEGIITKVPTEESCNNLICIWQRGKEYYAKPKILCSIPTRNRYDFLFQCLQSVAIQTTKPDKVVIYDDTPEELRIDMRDHPIGKHILSFLRLHEITWEVVFGSGQGQHLLHQRANLAGYDYVWRIDDDCIANPDVLERLISHMKPKVGAVGGAVYNIKEPSKGGTNKIEHFFHMPNMQWAPDQGINENAEYLYSSFLYRAGIANYKRMMSPAAFHEETIFTHRIKRNGWKLIVDTGIKTIHLGAPSGGTRDTSDWAYAWDRKEFIKVLEEEWKIKVIYLGVGLGDNLAFKNIIPDLKKKYKTIILGTYYPEVYEDCEGVIAVPHEKIMPYCYDNVYDFMTIRNWKNSIVDAFKEMYT